MSQSWRRLLTVVQLLTALTLTVSCKTAVLEVAKEEAREDSYKATIPEKRAGCLALKLVNYDYNNLDEALPSRTLRAAADQFLLFESQDSLQRHCEVAYARPATDILSKNFADDDRQGIINACKLWMQSIDPPITWREFRLVLTPWEPAYKYLSSETRQQVKEFGITRARLSRVYDRFGRSETEISIFCDAARRFE